MSDKDKVKSKLMNYMRKAVSDYGLIKPGDRICVCLSGGKDSYTMVTLLQQLQQEMKGVFDLSVYTLDQSQPGWDDAEMRSWLDDHKIDYCIETRNTYAVVKEKIPEGKSYCSLCSRLRRGNIYRYARDNGFNKVALGHHRDDLIQTLLMSICYSGRIQSMPPKLMTDDKQLVVIRPLVYCQEKDIKNYAERMLFPIIPCRLCGTQENLARQRIGAVIEELTAQNPKVPSNMLHALSSVAPSQLLDKNLFDFDLIDQEHIEEVIH